MAHHGRIKCARCACTTRVPSAGLSALPRNHAIQSLYLENIGRRSNTDKSAALELIDAVCHICCNPFEETTPLLLRCGHSICSSCARDCGKCVFPATVIQCPECHKSVDLKTHAITVNYTLLETVRVLQELMTSGLRHEESSSELKELIRQSTIRAAENEREEEDGWGDSGAAQMA